MEKAYNILALMSVPLCFILCRTYIRARLLELRAPDARVQRLLDENEDLKRRMEVLETIVTAPTPPALDPPRRSLQRAA